MADDNLDPDLLMWDVRRRVTADGMPTDRRFTVRFEFADVPSNKRRYWLVFDRGEADLCMRDPGFDVDLYVSAPVRTLAEVWLGHDTIRNATRNDRLRFEGARKDIARFTDWFALSIFAPAGRRPPGKAA